MNEFGGSYTKVKRGGKTALVLAAYSEVLAGALLDGAGCVPLPETGRGTVWRFDYPGGAGILRQYLRGGAMRLFLKDAYLLANRPLREFRLHLKAYGQGLAVPRPLGVCWWRHGLLVRGALATAALPAETLLQFLKRSGADIEGVLTRCGALVRRMHDMRIWHADLQVKNILVGEGGPWLIDFDNASERPNLSPLLRARNLLRLRRSFDKNNLSLGYFELLCEGYGAEAFPGWMSRVYEAKGRISDAARGK